MFSWRMSQAQAAKDNIDEPAEPLQITKRRSAATLERMLLTSMSEPCLIEGEASSNNGDARVGSNRPSLALPHLTTAPGPSFAFSSIFCDTGRSVNVTPVLPGNRS